MHRLQVALALRERLYSRPVLPPRLRRIRRPARAGARSLRRRRRRPDRHRRHGSDEGRRSSKRSCKVLGPQALIWKNDSGARELEGLPSLRRDGDRRPGVDERWSRKTACAFSCRWARARRPAGSTTRRPTGARSCKYVNGARVLDVFSYLGAWGLAAARAGRQRSALRGLVGARARTAAGVRRGQRPARRPHACATMPSTRWRRCARPARSSTWSSSTRRRSSSGARTSRRARRPTASSTSWRCRCCRATASSCRARARTTSAPDDLIGTIQQAARHVDRFAQIVEVGGHAPGSPDPPGDSRDALPEVAVLPRRARLRRRPMADSCRRQVLYPGQRGEHRRADAGTVDQKLAAGATHFTVLISTSGGSVFHGLTAYNYLKGIPARGHDAQHRQRGLDRRGAVSAPAGCACRCRRRAS